MSRAINTRTSSRDHNNDLVQSESPLPFFDAKSEFSLPEALFQARDAIIDATDELGDILLPPSSLIHRYGGANDLVCIQAIARWYIPDKVPLDDHGISYADLAAQLPIDEQMVRRLIRHAVTMRIFAEHEPGVVTHTLASSAMREPSLRAMMHAGSREVWPAQGSQRAVQPISPPGRPGIKPEAYHVSTVPN
ncbi:hypothetical protein EJ04DRAFT_567023 [Polyplosphaeria fusca]|uniref:O-methyltransferase dimerisation domain-containing protein n=1 Tax=Polyplosphaeria fusca TaxID=682080 RepID=A0A9P4QUI6_9PLEO|nr:hypothetical protein EJ04DRAFT_567023 [Polyplosphaeria fusca]